MKYLLRFLVIGAILISLGSCATMGRFFGRSMGQPTPVYR